MKKLIISSKLANQLRAMLHKDNELFMEKAAGHMYIRKWPDPKNPKRSRYLYAKDFLKPFTALASLFGLKKERVDADYEKNNIKQEYGVDKTTFASHILEYISNRAKWDSLFSKKENRDKYKTPQKQTATASKDASKGKKQEQKEKLPITINRSLMKKIWDIYNPKRAQEAAIEDSVSVENNNIAEQTVEQPIEEPVTIPEPASRLTSNNTEVMIIDTVDKMVMAMGYNPDFKSKDFVYTNSDIGEIISSTGLKGEFVGIRGDRKVVLREENGNEVSTDASLLSEESQIRIQEALKKAEIEPKPKPTKLINEEWEAGKLSVVQVAKQLREVSNYSVKNPTMGTLGVLGYVSPHCDGGNLRYWEFAARQIELMQEGKVTEEEVRYRLRSSDYDKIREKVIAEGKSLSEAMMGNDNAKKDFSEEKEAKEQMKKEQENEKKARKKAKRPPVEIHDRSSAMEDSSWDPKSENYRYKDTGYIAGSRKEMATTYIRMRAKEGTHIGPKEIDWQSIEENPRLAKQLITKSNIFGKVDWNMLKENGTTGGAAFLIDRVYASVGAEPAEDNADARLNYTIAIEGLRDRLEKCKTVEDVTNTVREIRAELRGDFIAAKETPEVLELSKQIQDLLKKQRELEEESRRIFNDRDNDLDRAAEEFYNKEVERIKANDKRKKRVSEYDFSPEARAEYERLEEIARKARWEKMEAHKQANGWSKKDGDGWLGNFFAKEIDELNTKRNILVAAKTAEITNSNPLHKAWSQLGKKFNGVVNYGSYKGSDTFLNHVSEARRGKYDNWDWATKDKIEVDNKGQKRRAKFELQVASKFVRKGGRNVKSESAIELKNNFKLRDVQFGNWVAEDPESAKFHVDNITTGLADLADITGIPDNLVSMNGRLAMAIGARGKGATNRGAVAHYEPIERVINITKMKGGGSLAHEWWHAFDNLISESMTGGDINQFLTDPYENLNAKQRKAKDVVDFCRKRLEENPNSSYYENSYRRAVKDAEAEGVKIPAPGSEEEHIERVKAAFNKLVDVMTKGDTVLKCDICYTDKDYDLAQLNIGSNNVKFAMSIKEAGSLDKALDVIYARGLNKKNQDEWCRMVAAYYDGNKEGNIVYANSGQKGTEFLKHARDLDGSGKGYWASLKEMSARAFSGYLDDKLRENDRLNDYLAYATTNEFYQDPFFGNRYPYPEGEERERINKAFDELFSVVNETGAIRKALLMGDLFTARDITKIGSLPKRKEI